MRIFRISAVFLFLVLTAALHAGSAEDVTQEIDHLLQYIESSECIFIRNSREGSAASARTHIQKKYEYFKEQVKTAEDFIRYAATESSMSGKPYRIRCSSREMDVADWLDAELRRFRSR